MTDRTKSILLLVLLCAGVLALIAPLAFMDDPIFMPHPWGE